MYILNSFFWFDPAPFTQFRDPGVRPAPRGAYLNLGQCVLQDFDRGSRIGFLKVIGWGHGEYTY